MVIQIFNINNKRGEFITFQTNSPNSTTFDPTIGMEVSKRGHWDLGVGGSYLGGNNISYTYPSSATKTVKFYVDKLKNITSVNLQSDNLVGHLNLSGTTLGGALSLNQNPLLTGVTHSYSNSIFVAYNLLNCDITGTLDLSMFPNLGGSFSTQNNINLTTIIHTASTRNFTNYNVGSCNITGTHDISMLSNLGGSSSASTGTLLVNNNPYLTGLLFPTTTGYFRNLSAGFASLFMNDSNLDYVNFKPLSGATMVSGVTQGAPKIRLDGNSMGAGDVNHILDDFKYNATNNPSGWSNVVLDIGGTNDDPDSSSGGYDGLAAIATLTGSPYNWTITY